METIEKQTEVEHVNHTNEFKDKKAQEYNSKKK